MKIAGLCLVTAPQIGDASRMEPLVDIVLATHNGAAHLEAQLASLCAQSHQNWRLIARDDGSSDATPEILSNFAAREARAVIMPSEAGRSASGPVAAFGAALRHSDAPYFMFCDQDDVWLPTKIKTLLAALRSAERAGEPCLSHSDLRVVDGDLKPIAPSFRARQHLPSGDATAYQLLLRNVVTGCAMMGNGALRSAMQPISQSALMHDWWAALIAAHQGQIISVPEATVLYRRHGGNVTGLASQGKVARELVHFAGIGRFSLAPQRAHLAALQAQARALAAIMGQGSLAAEFGTLRERGLLHRKTFLARKGLIRWTDPLWSLAYHWII